METKRVVTIDEDKTGSLTTTENGESPRTHTHISLRSILLVVRRRVSPAPSSTEVVPVRHGGTRKSYMDPSLLEEWVG